MTNRAPSAPQRGSRVAKWVGVTVAGVVGGLLFFGYSSELYLKKKIEAKAGAVALKVSWSKTRWGLGEACLDNVRWRHARVDVHGSAQSLCVSARWRWAWPPVRPEHVSVRHPKVVAPLSWLLASSEGQREDLRASGARPRRPEVSDRDLLTRLTGALPIDLDVIGGSLWLTQRGESVASFALQLNWRPLSDPSSPLAQLTGQARLRGIELPFDLRGTLDRHAVRLSAPRSSWRLPVGRHQLQLNGLSVGLMDRSLRLHKLGLRIDGLGVAELEASINPAQGVAQLGPGRITVEDPSATRALKRELNVIRERLEGYGSALGLTALASGTTSLPQRAPQQVGRLPALGRWRVLASELEVEGLSLSTGQAPLTLEDLMVSAEGARLAMTQPAQGDQPKTSARACLGEGCLNPLSSALWRVELHNLSVDGVARRIQEVHGQEGTLSRRLRALSDRVDGLLSLQLSGRALDLNLERLEELSVSLTRGALSLSEQEPPLQLPELQVVIPRRPSSDELPFTLFVGDSGEDRAELKGSIRAGGLDALSPELPSLNVQMRLSPLPCQRALALIPRGALGSIEQLSATGVLRPELTLSYHQGRVDFKLKRLLRSCTFHELRFHQRASQEGRVRIRGRRASGHDVLWLQEPFIFEVDPALTGGAKVQVGPGTASFVRLSELPSYVAGAMYLTEEMGFWTGGAISPSLIKNAINTNLSKGRFVYGGSTITQQLVKNLFLSRDKLLTRKLQEALIGARVIDAVGKERILELYLNCIEFGPGVFGIQSAARYYFQKDARALSPQQAVFLAMLKVSPARGARWRRRGSSPTFTWWRARSVEVFKRLVDKGLLSAKQAKGQAPFILKWDANGAYIGAEPLEL